MNRSAEIRTNSATNRIPTVTTGVTNETALDEVEADTGNEHTGDSSEGTDKEAKLGVENLVTTKRNKHGVTNRESNSGRTNTTTSTTPTQCDGGDSIQDSRNPARSD